MNKLCVLISFFICIISTSSWAKEDLQKYEIKPHLIDWKIPSYLQSSYSNKKTVNNCSKVTIDLPLWISSNYNSITIHKKFTKNKLLPYISNSDFILYCNTQNIDMSDQGVFYNQQIKQWDLSSKDKNELINITVNDNDGNYTTQKRKLYQLNAKNANGWLYTEIINTSFDNPQMSSGIKHAWFCLINTKKTQQVCGDGEVQDIVVNHGKPDFNNGDYTPYLLQILETLKFEDDK